MDIIYARRNDGAGPVSELKEHDMATATPAAATVAAAATDSRQNERTVVRCLFLYGEEAHGQRAKSRSDGILAGEASNCAAVAAYAGLNPQSVTMPLPPSVGISRALASLVRKYGGTPLGCNASPTKPACTRRRAARRCQFWRSARAG
jgi:hypothetical protein